MICRLVEQGREAENLQECIDDLEADLGDVHEERDELQEEVERGNDLKQEVDRLKNEKQMILAEREEEKELTKYVGDERTAQQRRRQAGFLTRLKWRAVGMPAEN